MSPGERPSRLAESGEPAARALRAFERSTRPEPRDEAVAWQRFSARHRDARGAVRWFWGGAVAAAAVAALVLVNRFGVDAPVAVAPTAVPIAPARGPEIAPVPPVIEQVQQDVAPAPAAPPARRVALSRRPLALAPGSAALAQARAHGKIADVEATVDVAPHTKAHATSDSAWVRVVLQRGEVGLHVAKRVAGGPGFEVVAGAYRFRVLGTRFRVARGVRGAAPREAQDSIELWVEEGRVAVSRKGHALGVVGAGGHWDARPSTSAAARVALAHPHPAASRVVAARVTEAPPVAAAPAPRARCAALAGVTATAREAVSCYLDLARGDGLSAETALYEVARLRRDVLGDGAGALSALQESRARFPAGMLRQEVDLSIVELLPKLNRHREAIAEIGRLLGDGERPSHGVERAAELHVLRGNIYREVLEDFARAERDYAAAEAERAPAVGDATFLRGVCLQALGRADEARAAFQGYLGAGTPRFADEARRRLQRLGL